MTTYSPKYSNYENAAVFVALSSVLVERQITKPPIPFDVFIGESRKGESLAQRLCNGVKCKYSAYVLALLYLRRLKDLDRSMFTISQNTFERVVATAAVVASKFFDDVYFSNEHYAKELGFSLDVMNEMEIALVVMLKFRLQVDVEVFSNSLVCFDQSRVWYCQSQHCAVFSGLKTCSLPAEPELLVALGQRCCDIEEIPTNVKKNIKSFWQKRMRIGCRYESEEEHLCRSRLQIKACCVSRLLQQVKLDYDQEKARERLSSSRYDRVTDVSFTHQQGLKATAV